MKDLQGCDVILNIHHWLVLGEKVLVEWLIWDLRLVRRINSEKPSIWLIVSLKFAMSWSEGELLTHWDKKSLETQNFVAESCSSTLVTKTCWERWNIFCRFGWEGNRTKYKPNTLGQSNNPRDIFILPGLMHWQCYRGSDPMIIKSSSHCIGAQRKLLF